MQISITIHGGQKYHLKKYLFNRRVWTICRAGYIIMQIKEITITVSPREEEAIPEKRCSSIKDRNFTAKCENWNCLLNYNIVFRHLTRERTNDFSTYILDKLSTVVEEIAKSR